VPLPTVLDPRYSDGCPASRLFHFHGYSGSGKSIMALSLVDGRIKVDQQLADIVFACTACGLCDVSCNFIMEAERHSINMALREHIVDEGFTLSAHRTMIEDLQTHGNPQGRVEVPALGWSREMGLKIPPEQKAPVLLFTGCMRCSDPEAAEVARKCALLLKHAGVDFGIMREDATCCGLPAYWMGHRDVFVRSANRLWESSTSRRSKRSSPFPAHAWERCGPSIPSMPEPQGEGASYHRVPGAADRGAPSPIT
jgi:Fe-S oxidoreductase